MGRVIGFMVDSASLTLTLRENDTAWLSSLYSRVRGRGDAKAVVRRVLAHADERGLTVFLSVGQFGPGHISALSNEELIDFYGRFGFVICENEFDISRNQISMMRMPGSQDLHLP